MPLELIDSTRAAVTRVKTTEDWRKGATDAKEKLEIDS